MNKDIKNMIFKSIGLAMGIATLVLTVMKSLESKSAITLLSIGLICLAINELETKK
ncbi:hypothetical protein SDC9_57559 [bioreactor metagenome]|uniref:Uncharacterized protein n=2 Tax=root TaxID=1 RepID=A0A562JBN6_9FIRM|nr:hypothetical protein [Sedimentibacter saalensis]MEA5093979.1 hypothetical protein [Sedimentibacter saalensis]TWH80520.1 hypothetical protein LY60_01782 [Sedimentibacter saalensis]